MSGQGNGSFGGDDSSEKTGTAKRIRLPEESTQARRKAALQSSVPRSFGGSWPRQRRADRALPEAEEGRWRGTASLMGAPPDAAGDARHDDGQERQQGYGEVPSMVGEDVMNKMRDPQQGAVAAYEAAGRGGRDG
ncbi:hypothetical protein THAOC_14331 [Thalassiosira oceanica]|uniref:Uncharacterized protein n=1 Tax=Thalassiosira oceanica TaxID=159749 RepID=K0SIT1_THAOC|nr:hypothetical protein THAOC_14331 [Thalassiosira oceanica]|eukprot:EJK64884.1 hypothetical protein THAOC_14331 [Thalassiosira oceanica]